jgi:hypothetical protein
MYPVSPFIRETVSRVFMRHCLLGHFPGMLPIPHFRSVVKRVYKDADIFDYLSQPVLSRGAISDISDQTEIATNTLADWPKNRTTLKLAIGFPSSPDTR